MLYHLAIYLGDCFWGSGTSLYWALSRLVGTTTNGALLVRLLLGALGYDMSYHLTPIASGDAGVWVRVVEDGHFHSSPSTRWEWTNSPDDSGCLYEGRPDQGVARAYRDWVDKVVLAIQLLIRITNLQPLFYRGSIALQWSPAPS